MPNRDDLQWFKETFQRRIEPAIAATPFTVDLLTAIAAQETGHIWSRLRHTMSLDEVLALCVGDTLDEDAGRRAFPRRKADLIAVPRGGDMFTLAHDALVRMARHVPGFTAVAKRPDKFCHAFGIFQYDLQFFKTDPGYFLEQRWRTFEASLAKAIEELRAAAKRIGLGSRPTLTDLERVHVAIAYNAGGFKPAKGLKQGHFNGTQFYGELIFDFQRLAQTVPGPSGGAPAIPPPAPGTAPISSSPPLTAVGPLFEIDVRDGPLRLRSEPKVPRSTPHANVIAQLPDGHRVRLVAGRIGGRSDDEFVEVETKLQGALFRGFAASTFLVRVSEDGVVAGDDGGLSFAIAETRAAAPARGRGGRAMDAPSGVVATTPSAAGSSAAETPDDATAFGAAFGIAGAVIVPVSTPVRAIVAVAAPRPAGSITTRRANATAHSLNEASMPGRTGNTPAALRAELGAIVDYLAVDKPTHKRYAPRDGLTFCNIYAHDYCHLAGVYLPRVWWTQAAIARLARGEEVAPRLDATIEEQRANSLFRWLRDFGEPFGWRRVSTPTDLQTEVNIGAVGLIIARRTEDGRSGHITMVVPETPEHAAKRNRAGDVTHPLQSEAGRRTIRYGTGRINWWRDAQFADSAFWIHP